MRREFAIRQRSCGRRRHQHGQVAVGDSRAADQDRDGRRVDRGPAQRRNEPHSGVGIGRHSGLVVADPVGCGRRARFALAGVAGCAVGHPARVRPACRRAAPVARRDHDAAPPRRRCRIAAWDKDPARTTDGVPALAHRLDPGLHPGTGLRRRCHHRRVHPAFRRPPCRDRCPATTLARDSGRTPSSPASRGAVHNSSS